MASPSDLTIISVIFSKKTENQIKLNAALVKAVNPTSTFRWLLGYNYSESFPQPSQLEPNSFFAVIECINNDLDYDANSNKPTLEAGDKHGLALNILFEKVESRYLLVLDPDFYVVRKGWIDTVLNHMKKYDLAFFGSTWDPKNFKKYRYFPSIHFFLIDLHKIPRDHIDFFGADIKRKSPSFSLRCVRRILGKYSLIFDRSSVSVNRDPGTRIFLAYRKSTLGVETLRPSFQLFSTNRPRSFLTWAIFSFFDRFFPEEKRIFPKPGYYTTDRFNNYTYCLPSQYSWEEFFWNKHPFAFHCRNTLTSTSKYDIEDVLYNIQQAIETATSDNFS